jgi:hypothetical protein
MIDREPYANMPILTNPRDEEMAREALAPLLNPEPHPFQEQFSDAHSITIDTLVMRVTEAIAKARGEGLLDGLAEEDE